VSGRLALALVEEYLEHLQAENKGKIFPVPCNQKTNAYLKEIADLCGTGKPLATRLACIHSPPRSR
jgi:hypothetical protein